MMANTECSKCAIFNQGLSWGRDRDSKQLLPGLLVDSADYHPEKELFPEGNARGK